MRYDYCVIGGGIVGLATARALLQHDPAARLLLVEKEDALGTHQSGHNSGVIHSGIYYEPGSLKAELCRRGAQLTRTFCERHGIDVHDTGKLIVATSERELAGLAQLESRAGVNGIEVDRLDAGQIQDREPHIRGLAALFIRSTAVVDYRKVVQAIAQDLRASGADIVTGVRVTQLDERGDDVRVVAAGTEWTAGRLVVCGGLQADRLARKAGLDPDFQIVPFRGEYYRLADRIGGLIDTLIYPVPDPDLPFLGVHLTTAIDGSVSVGPNAVLGMAREGYSRWAVNPRDVATYARWPGFWRMARANMGPGLAELRSAWSKRAYLRLCRRYCPDLTLADLTGRHMGIRAQAVLRDGTLAHDFLFVQSDRMLHVGNAPSPAATSALPIGEHIAQRLAAGVS